MRITQFCLVFWTLLTFRLYGQNSPHELYFTQYAEELSVTNISSIVQDTSGFIWIGTAAGLNRFDGVDFVTFEASQSDSSSITDNRVNDLLLDQKGRLWIATYQDLMRYNYENASFEVISRLDNSGIAIDALDIEQDSEGQIWIGTLHGLYKLDQSSQRLVRSASKEHLALDETRIFQISFDQQDRMWLGTESGLVKFSEGEPITILPETQVLSIAFGDSFVWAGTQRNGLFQLSQSGEVLEHYTLTEGGEGSQNRVFDVLVDSKEQVWVGTEFGGLKLLQPKDQSFLSFQKGTWDGSLKSNSVWEIFEDRAGRLWLGTNNQGVFVTDPNHSKFGRVIPMDQGRVQLKFGTVSSFLELENEFWIGTDGGGISRYDSTSASFSFFDKTPEGGGLGSDEVLTLFQDSDGIIWAGNWGGGLNRYDPSSGDFKTFIHDEHDPHSIGSNNVFAIKESLDGRIWCTTWGKGLSSLDKSTGLFDHIGYIPYNSTLLSSDLTYDMEIDEEGNLWVATVLGLDQVIFSEDTFRIEHYRPEESDPQSLSNINVNSILIDSRNWVWVGTKFGLNVMKPRSGDFSRYFKEDGLSDNDIKDIIEDDLGQYWITTGKGLTKAVIRNQRLVFETYDESDGLQSPEFFNNSTRKAKDGRIFLGGLNGFNHFYPLEIRRDTITPKVQFTDLKLFNQIVQSGPESVLSKELNLTPRLVLNHQQSVFTLDYLAVHFTHAHKNQFAFMLEGLESQWNYVGTQKQATYTNLDAGSYVFKVKAANHDGIWGVERSLEIQVLPPWWESWWFRTIGFVSIVTFFLTVYIFRVNFLKVQQARLQSEVDRQTQELKQTNDQLERLGKFKELFTGMLVHDLKNALHLILGLSEKADNQSMREVNQSGRKMLHMVSNMLDIQKFEETQMTIRPENLGLSMLVNEAKQQFGLLFKSKSLTFQNKVGDHSINADPELLGRVLINLLSNAVKYTPFGGCITISAFKNENRVIVEVSDTGEGIPQDQRELIFDTFHQSDPRKLGKVSSTGLGLTFCKMVVEAHGGQIGVRPAEGGGSTFYFDIQHAPQATSELVSDSEDQAKNTLTDAELQAIRQLKPQLEMLQMYEVSKIEELINGISDTDPVKAWKEAVKTAAYNWNEKKFKELINL